MITDAGEPDTGYDPERYPIQKRLFATAADHPAAGDSIDGVHYLFVCRVLMGCSLRTDGRGVPPRCLDEGATASGTIFAGQTTADCKMWRELELVAGMPEDAAPNHHSLV